MKVTRIGDLIQLTFLPGFFPVNCYIVEDNHGLTLIDTGIPSSYKGIVDVIEKLGKPLTNILLTHAHGDHVGSLNRLKEKFPSVPLSISARDSRLLKGDTSLDQDEPQTPIKGGIPKDISLIPDKLLKEDDSVGSLRVVLTPGHTPGSISFFDTRSKAIIVGDALQTRGGIAVSGQIRPMFPFPAMATWNKEKSLGSVKKIKQYSPSLLAVGHGDLLSDPDIQLQIAIEKAEKNLSR
ncbi:glyoxylase-like metal-dependent hydrolase (beta-lactamase superfamily II) [Metabacillus crassostreae]|uniref:MBL fold metallo-hydrolase n=1 Tax=Metabacillus crassostreae TaxID=929098 RepID=UPI00195B57C8|nr:MBL fold metallo-hydrolase [Metabacillus crassostreae]MBM7603821.1 glyoxylase-like metal-dependent hydrolase (beta-lactamase superfamily II) [Metabacillus crassostreae]